MIKKPRFVKKVCLCGCGKEFIQCRYYKGYIKGHSQKITRKKMVGDKAPGWKGGITKKRGYVYTYSPKHPNPSYDHYVKRSRLNMEKKIGRFLKRTEIVHHIDGVRDDDRIENLVVITRARHNTIHKTKKV